MNILLVEDETLIAMMMVDDLEDNGHRVTNVYTCDDALKLLQTNTFDAMITDIRTPGVLDGWGLAIEARRLHPKLPIVYATAQAQDEDRQVPESCYIQKPYRVRDLTKIVEHAQAEGVT